MSRFSALATCAALADDGSALHQVTGVWGPSVSSVFLLVLGYKVRKATTKEWILYLTGALSVLTGVLVAANPLVGGVSIVYVIAGWAIAIGALKVLFAFRVRNLAGNQGDRASALG